MDTVLVLLPAVGVDTVEEEVVTTAPEATANFFHSETQAFAMVAKAVFGCSRSLLLRTPTFVFYGQVSNINSKSIIVSIRISCCYSIKFEYIVRLKENEMEKKMFFGTVQVLLTFKISIVIRIPCKRLKQSTAASKSYIKRRKCNGFDA